MPRFRRPCRPCLACTAMFIVVSVLMVLGFTHVLDDATLRFVGDIRTPATTAVMHAITALGDGAIEIPIAFAIMAVLWRVSGRKIAMRYFWCAITGELLYVVMKTLFHRPRPSIIPRLGKAGWYSYPSGHAMLGPIIFGVGLWLLAYAIQHRGTRRALIALAFLIPLAIGLSRVYLGVHYPSDVLGALALGSGWALLWFGTPDNSCATPSAPATI